MKINEVTDKRLKIITTEKDDKLYREIKAKCKQAILALKKERAIFKGLHGSDYDYDVYLTNPKLKIRKSQNTSNQYTLLFSNLPSWKDYPKRNRSLICTTSVSIAKGYGRTFLVLPLDGAKIGVCPGQDMWDTTLISIGKNVHTIDFVEILENRGITGNTYEQLMKSFVKNKSELYSIDTFSSYFITELKKCNNTVEMEQLLNKFLNPTHNKFELKSCFSLPKMKQSYDDDSYECWTDSESYLVKIGTPFCSKYFYKFN
jgi:hypothetical protein